MKRPHSGGKRARSQSGYSRPCMRGARGKASRGSEFPCGARQSAAEVILGVAVAAWKPGTAGAHDGGDLGSGDAMTEQFLGDPLVHNAPIGLWEASGNSQPVQPLRVDFGGSLLDSGRDQAQPQSAAAPGLAEGGPLSPFPLAVARRRRSVPRWAEHTGPSPKERNRVRRAAAASG